MKPHSFRGSSIPSAALCLALLVISTLSFSSARAADGQNPSFPEKPINIESVKYIEAAKGNNVLEGAIFDAKGNLLFCDVTEHKVKVLGPDNEVKTLIEIPDLPVGGIALSKDGRLFMAALDLVKKQGAVLAWSPKTNKIETIVPVKAGFWPNDLVLDKNGGIYFSDFRGSSTSPKGGIYYVDPNDRKITAVIPNLAQANGVALSPDGKVLWATEFAANRLHRVELESPTSASVIGTSIPYRFTGPAPDSMRVDSKGNVYVAVYTQGKVEVFNNRGMPIGNILLPLRNEGKNLLSTSLAIHPDKNELFVVSSNKEKTEPAAIFSARSFAPGQKPEN